MAKAFNLTAQINLQGPVGLKPIVSQIKKEFGAIKTNLNLNIDPNAAKKVANITSGVQNLSKALDRASISVTNLNTSFSSLGNTLGNIKSASSNLDTGFSKVASSSRSSAKASKEAATEMEAFGKASALALKRFAAFSVVSTSIYGLVNSVNDAINEFIIFDRELVRLSQVLNNNIGQFGQLSTEVQDISNEVTRLSTSLGVSSQDLIKVASTLSQAGLSATETKVALEALAKSSLAPSFEDINQTTEGAIAALRQFGLSASDLEGTLGSVNAVAAAFAVESDDIIKAIQRTGGVFAASSRGITTSSEALNQFIAIFTSVRATTRESAETIATGLRTIFTRIQRSSTIDKLKEYGVLLTDFEDKFVGPYEAVKRLSEGLSAIDPRDLKFSEIVEELGGFRQIGKVIPLIQQFATAEQALAVANQGTTSLTNDTKLALLSLGNQFARTREEFLAMIREFANTSTIKGLTTGTLALTRGFISIVGALKPLLPLITTFATLKLAEKTKEFTAGFSGQLFGGRQQSITGTSTTSTARSSATTINSSNTTALIALTRSIDNLNNTIKASSLTTGRKGFASGGLVGGTGNRDTVPAMLTPGEFVIRKNAVKNIGVDNLQNINRYAVGGKIKDLIDKSTNSQSSRYLTKTYDTDGPFDTYDTPKIIRSPITQPKTGKAVNREQTRSAAEKLLSKAREIYRTDGLDAANQFLSQRTQKMISKLPEDHFDRDTTQPINKIQGAIAEKKVAENFKRIKTQFTKLPYIGGSDFSMSDTTSFVEVKNRQKIVPDNELIIKSLLAYAYTNGQQQIITDPTTNKISKSKGFRDGKLTRIPSLNIQLYTTNPDDISQEKNIGGIIQKFNLGGSNKDTVPALLTPGEFVIRKEAAQKLGSAALHKLNNADKLQGYNKGGFVGGVKVQTFADGGDVEAAIQRILMSLEPIVQQAEKAAYRAVRNPQFDPNPEKKGRMIKEGATAQESLRIARIAAIEAAKAAAKSAKGVISQRTGTDYTTSEAASEKKLIDAALKKMLRSIESGTDPAIRGKTTKRREAGYFEREITDKESETTVTEKAINATEDSSKAIEKMSLSITDLALLASNVILPQLQQFADGLKITDSALGSAASKAVEAASSFGLSASLGLKAVGLSGKNVAIGTGLAVAGGAIGGGLEAFAAKSLEKAILKNTDALNDFDKVLKQTSEAPTEQLRLEASSQLEASFRRLTTTIDNSKTSISSLENLQNVGTAISSATNTIIGLGTATLAATQAINASQASAAASAAATGTATASLVTAGRAAVFIGGTLLKFAGWIGIAITAGTALYQVFSSLTKTSTSATEQLEKYVQRLKELTQNSNDFNLANQRYTTEILNQFAELRKNTTPEDLKKLLGQTQTVSSTGQLGSPGTASNLNQFNLLLDQYIREQLRSQGLLIQSEQSIQQFINSLGVAGQKLAKEIVIEATGGLERTSPNQKLTKLEESIFIKARQEGDANLTKEAIQRQIKELSGSSEGLSKMRTIIEANVSSFNEYKLSNDLLAASLRKQQIAVLNLTDVLNRLGAGLDRINVETSNSFDDILYNFKRSTEQNVPVREDVTASRSAQVLKNISAYSAKELSSAVDEALSTMNLNNRTNFVETRFQDAQSIKDAVLAFQKVQTEVPMALREFAQIQQAQPGSTIDLKEMLSPIFAPLNLDTKVKNTILEELQSSIDRSTGLTGEGTLEIEQVIGRFKELSKNLDVNKLALENLSKAQDIQAEQNKRLAEVANALSSSYATVNELNIQSAKLTAETALEMQRITGQVPSLGELNAPFDRSIKLLTKSIMDNGTLDPAVIGKAIADKQAQLSNIRLSAGEDTKIIAQLNTDIKDLQNALSMLGNKNDRLINALDNLRQVEEERKGVGDLFEEMIKASRDPIARMDIQATIDAAQRVRAGSTNIEDVIRTLDKFIPMLAKTGPQGQTAAEALKNQIFARGAAQGSIENLLAGNIKNALGGLNLVNLFSGGQTKKAKNIVDTEEERSRKALLEMIQQQKDAQERAYQGIVDVHNTYKQSMSDLLPNITGQMKTFLEGIKQLNQEKGATKIPPIKMDVEAEKQRLKDILTRFSSISKPTMSLTPGIGVPMQKKVVPKPTITTASIDKATTTSDIADLSIKLDAYVASVQTSLDSEIGSVFNVINFALKNRLQQELDLAGKARLQLKNIIEQGSTIEQQQIKSNLEGLGVPNPSRTSLLNQQAPAGTSTRFGVRDVTNEPDFNVQGPVGGGAFTVPPEKLNAQKTAAANVTTTPKLDFNYNDFITKFSTAFDTETGKFRNVIKDLSLSFTALQAPIDTFSKSVNKLIDGLNAINDNGGIKGPNIPEKVTIQVVFDEDLTIDTSRINNNDLLNQIGVVTKEAINNRIKELKLTGQ
jgi:TP901 family phage tail tape measure protein